MFNIYICMYIILSYIVNGQKNFIKIKFLDGKFYKVYAVVTSFK